MNMQGALPRKYLAYPAMQSEPSKFERAIHALKGLFLWPIYWYRARKVNTPGLAFRSYFMRHGIRLLVRKHDARSAYRLVVMPLDSVRYFEFDFMWQSVAKMQPTSYLDVSSPRLLPLMVVERHRQITADLVNPDARDLRETVAFAQKLDVAARCRFHADLIGDLRMEPGSFQLITSMSVIEHIGDDRAAIRKMWALLRPGGKLVITLPCAAQAYEEYHNRNDYELGEADAQGFIFFQRYYDDDVLRENVFSITGAPVRSRIYGERQAGTYFRTEEAKRTDPFFPYWRAPYDVGIQYQYYDRMADLPGIGVIALEFEKPLA